MLEGMTRMPDSPLERLWKEYGTVFGDFDDLTLARWLSQTLGQLEGRAWRLSHPLVGVYRLGARSAHDRQIWFKRLASIPSAYSESPCCRAPLLPLLTRDVLESGLICQHCGEMLADISDLPEELQQIVRPWAEEYEPVHLVAHWKEEEQKRAGDYEARCDEAAEQAEKLLLKAS